MRPPRQARSRATFERLLDAAEELLEREGIEGTSMAAVADAAGSSIGALYARVPDKRALVRTVQVRVLARQVAAIATIVDEEELATLPLERLVEAYVAGVVRAIGPNTGVIRALIVQAVRDRVMRDRVNLGLDAARAVLARLLRARAGELGDHDPDVAADMAVRIFSSVIQQRVLLDRELPDETLVAELRRALVAYLLRAP